MADLTQGEMLALDPGAGWGLDTKRGVLRLYREALAEIELERAETAAACDREVAATADAAYWKKRRMDIHRRHMLIRDMLNGDHDG